MLDYHTNLRLIDNITFAAYYFHCTDLPFNNVQFMELFIKY